MLIFADFQEIDSSRESWCTKTHVSRRSTCNEESVKVVSLQSKVGGPEAANKWREVGRSQVAMHRYCYSF